MGIEVGPGGGLNGEVHRFRLTEVSIEPRATARSTHCDTISTGFALSSSQTQTPRMGVVPDAMLCASVVVLVDPRFSIRKSIENERLPRPISLSVGK